MAELATIARPYAEALFKASSSDVAGTSAWLEKVAAIGANPELQQLADNPKVTAEQVLGVVAGAFAAPLPAAAQNFLAALLENGRFSVLPEIAKQFRALANAKSGSSDAVVYSAFPIEVSALAGVAAALEKRFGRKLQVTVQQEPELIGGIRVVVGDEVLDTSVKARLEQMKVALAA
ncbi:F0F1 ATP synthase subunit delta [Variovorax sp. Root434]|jgi:F-type H+-transporting ATPase subunit delta|uniref:F0F1 ATP synthase subunit delta n=1 Tax=Variovorax sp. Root434 TaxID=1736536 RepID=UPI0006F61846|nr:F0F1 ATP synthase subunit delta [Variovorax sp. Root434]KQX35036.1 ATP synthase F0F1 subunit delta [Variovorax sp. Root434]